METQLPSRIQPDCLIDLACAAWRLRRQVIDQTTGEPKEDAHHLAPRVSAIWNALSELGLQIEDRTGDVIDWDALQAAEVLAWETRPEALPRTVLETVRPAVYLNGKRILKGLIVVAAPARVETA